MPENNPEKAVNTAQNQEITSSKPKFPIILILSLLFLLIGGIGGYYFGANKAVNPPASTIITPSILPSPFVSQSSPDETANWKTYSHPKYNYFLKYPTSWSVEESNYSGSLASTTLKLNENPLITLIIYIDSSWEGKGDARTAEKNFTIANINAVKKSLPAGQNPPQELIFFEKDNLVYTIQLIWDGKNTQVLNVFDQILSTFKFLDQTHTQVPTDWKTYQNTDLSFKYPSDWIVSGYIISANSPKVKITIIPKDGTLMNECMKLISEEIKSNYVIKKFTRVTTGDMCSTSDATPREIWIIPSQGAYAPGISYTYSSTEQKNAEEILDQILSTFKFLD